MTPSRELRLGSTSKKIDFPSATLPSNTVLGAATHGSGAWKPQNERSGAADSASTLTTMVGEPVAYVQVLQTKGHRDRLVSVFPTPRSPGIKCHRPEGAHLGLRMAGVGRWTP